MIVKLLSGLSKTKGVPEGLRLIEVVSRTGVTDGVEDIKLNTMPDVRGVGEVLTVGVGDIKPRAIPGEILTLGVGVIKSKITIDVRGDIVGLADGVGDIKSKITIDVRGDTVGLGDGVGDAKSTITIDVRGDGVGLANGVGDNKSTITTDV